MSYSHTPIEDVNEDKLNFASKAKDIASFINNTRSDIPYAISINGTWGVGKSTLLNFVEQYIDQNKCSVIRFNPWMITNKEDLIYLLFEEIYYCIDSGYTKAKTKFVDYSKKFIAPLTKVATYFGAATHGLSHQEASATSEATSTIIGALSKDFFEKPLSKQKKELEEELKVMFTDNNKKIVIMIDELDRLFPNEIITIFQLIKSTLCFPGLFFIVTMDTQIVHDSLKTVGISTPETYLQKIFQRNYMLGSLYQLRTLTKEFLLPLIDTQDKESRKYLSELLDTFILLNEDNFIKLEDGKTINGQQKIEEQQKNVQQSYFKLFGVLREEFENPRTFINLIDYILDKWDNFFNDLKGIVELNQINLQSAFLIFLAYFKYPHFVNLPVDWIDGKYPIMLVSIRKHFNATFQETRLDMGDGKVSIIKHDSVIRKSVILLNRYPDVKSTS